MENQKKNFKGKEKMIFEKIKKEIRKVIVAQDEMVDSVIIALLSGGHILIEGMPGLAKTTTIKTLAKALGVDYKRIQFTPDLLPSDIMGAEIFNPKDSDFRVKKGPVFTNLLLADEINRAPSKVQSALLEAMGERQVTIGEKSYKLKEPFVVMATQNPIEQEGTYRLPEAQLDRFMMKIVLDYNTIDEEFEILNRAEKGFDKSVKSVVDALEIAKAKEEISKIFIDDALKRYILNIIFATRKHPDVMFGSSPRGSIDILKASKVIAYREKRDFVTPKDILDIVKPILRHRIILKYEARAEGKKSDSIIEEIVKEVPIP